MPVGTDIAVAAQLLEKGELVAIPTETVYGLGGNAFNTEAVMKIYEAKQRPQFNPLIIHSNTLEKFESWGIQLPVEALRLAAVFSPGPLTYVVARSPLIPDIVTAGNDAVAIRIPGHPLTLGLLARLDFPVAAPSANPSGFISPTSAKHVEEQLGNQVAYILDGGACKVGIESTIISFLEDTPRILRYGGIPEEEIIKLLGHPVQPPPPASQNVIAPGMLSRHYASKHQLIHDDPAHHLGKYNPERIGIISFQTTYPAIPFNNQFVLSETGDLHEAARKLFAAMREADKLDIDVILAERFPPRGLGNAINDRLRRASVAE